MDRDKKINRRLVFQTEAKIYNLIIFISSFVIKTMFLIEKVWECVIGFDCTIRDILNEKFMKCFLKTQIQQNLKFPRGILTILKVKF